MFKLENGEFYMNIIELQNTDIFTFKNLDNVYFGHCISSDAAMGKGIAPKFVKHFPKIKILRSNNHLEVGKTYLVDNVFNLITKPRYYEKPTYDSFRQSVKSLATQCNELNKDTNFAYNLAEKAWNYRQTEINELKITIDKQKKLSLCN